MADREVLVSPLDDLIQAKEAAGRPKDLAMLDELCRLAGRARSRLEPLRSSRHTAPAEGRSQTR